MRHSGGIGLLQSSELAMAEQGLPDLLNQRSICVLLPLRLSMAYVMLMPEYHDCLMRLSGLLKSRSSNGGRKELAMQENLPCSFGMRCRVFFLALSCHCLELAPAATSTSCHILSDTQGRAEPEPKRFETVKTLRPSAAAHLRTLRLLPSNQLLNHIKARLASAGYSE